MRLIVFIAAMTALSACTPKKESADKVLFNGKDLSDWDTYLGPAYDSASSKFDSLSALGLNNDPNKVFSVVQVDGQGALRLSGHGFGGISTREEFENFHLSLEFKWGTAKFLPRKDKPRDSGILYFATGPYDAGYGNWMCSQEFQVQEGDCGDYWSIAGSTMDIRATGQAVEQYVYDPAAGFVTFSYTSPAGKRCRKNPDAEKPSGEWNTVDIYCLGDSSLHVMNGKLVMKLYRSRRPQEGTEVPMTKGKIQLQVEGAEIFYRNLVVRSIDEFPKFSEQRQ